MSSLLGIVCILSALATTGYSLVCTSCYSVNSTQCDGKNITCGDNSNCASVLTEETLGVKTSKTFLRLCVAKTDCDINGTITYSDRKISLATRCCSSDRCLPDVPKVPDDTANKVRNNVTCRSCHSDNSNWCYTSDTVVCNGTETMCVRQETKVTGDKSTSHMAFRGCATKSICDLKSQTVDYGGKTVDTKFFCTDGSISLHKSSFTTLVVAFFFLKWVILF